MSCANSLAADEVDRRLRDSLRELRQAERNAVLWFAEVQERRLYRDLGFSSIYHYATEALGFSRPRTAQFIRLCGCLDDLPVLKGSLAVGDVSWTKAREIAKVATPENEKTWVELARRGSRRKLERRVRITQTRSRAKRRSRNRQLALDSAPMALDSALTALDSATTAAPVPGGASTGVRPEDPDWSRAASAVSGMSLQPRTNDGPPTPDATDMAFAPDTIDGPVNLSLRFTPDQYARYEALMEKLRKNGERGSREELFLAGMEALLSRGQDDACGVSPGNSKPDYQIVVQQCEDCGQRSIPTSRGSRLVGVAKGEAMQCDALVHRPGKPNRATIPPSVRRAVLARDGYRCKTPGCDSARFLEVHHRTPRAKGGSNKPENLVTLCSACHQLAHEGREVDRPVPHATPTSRRESAG